MTILTKSIRWTNFTSIRAFIDIYQDSAWHRLGQMTHLERPGAEPTCEIHLKCDGLPVFLTVVSRLHAVTLADEPLDVYDDDTYRIVWPDESAHLFRARIEPE